MSVISNFPTPYINEDFRSIVYRYHTRQLSSSWIETKHALFGIKSAKLGLFPRNILHLIELLPHGSGLTEERIINQTLLPLYKCFLSPAYFKKIHSDFLGQNEIKQSTVGRLALFNTPKLISENPKYCPECMREDFCDKGECYLHSEHQFNFVKVCPQHKASLIEYCPECGHALTSQTNHVRLLLMPQCPHCHSELISTSISNLDQYELQGCLLEDIKFLIAHSDIINSKSLYSKLISQLGTNGYISLKGMVQSRKVLLDLITYYEEKNLEQLGIGVEELLTPNFLYRWLKPFCMYNSILLYLLLFRFLAGSAEELLTSDIEYSTAIPFGNGPWDCINPVCQDFECSSIKKCRRLVDDSRTIKGMFVCPACQSEYSKKWDYDDQLDNNRINIRFRGSSFIERILHLRDCQMSVTVIADELQASPNVVSYLLKKAEKARHFRMKDPEYQKMFLEDMFNVDRQSNTIIAEDIYNEHLLKNN
jgi:hypothetical protein